MAALAFAGASPALGQSPVSAAMTQYRSGIEPVLKEYCYDCHGDGMDKGRVTLDQFASEEAMLGSHELWLHVLKNVRAGLMPPAKKKQPTAEQKQASEYIDALTKRAKEKKVDLGRMFSRPPGRG